MYSCQRPPNNQSSPYLYAIRTRLSAQWAAQFSVAFSGMNNLDKTKKL
jgi:hypothetical protein